MLYRTGTKGQKNLTPRASDLDGLSMFDSMAALVAAGAGKSGDTVQVFDRVLLLQEGLDAVSTPPPPGHVSLGPLDPLELDAWIATRDAALESPLTNAVRRAIIRAEKVP